MALALSVVDAADGTGGSATISGSLGATNTLYYSIFSGEMTQITWGAAGSVIGDGTIPLPLATGYYLFQLMSDTTLGPAFYRSFTDSTIDPMHFRVLSGFQARINLLAYVPTSRVLIKWIPRFTDPEIQLMTTGPIIFISPPGAEADVSAVVNQEDFEYPVLTAIGYKQNQDSVANLKQMLRFREKVRRAMNYQRLPGITENMWITPKPLAIVDPDEYTERNLLVSALGFGVRIRQTRGLT